MVNGNIPSTPKGSVGIGAGSDQVCRFRDMTVAAEADGKILYSSGLNNSAVLSDFGVGWNQLPYVMDGAKRDRHAWTADLITGAHAMYYSTAGDEYVRGNIEASMLRPSMGWLHGGIPVGRAYDRPEQDTMFEVLSVNYSLYLIIVIYDYWMFTGDLRFVERYWQRLTRCLSYVSELINSDGLVEVYGREGKPEDATNSIC